VKRSNRLVIFLGVLLAILAFVGVVIVLNHGTTPIAQTAKVNVVLAKDNIAIGEPVTPDKLQETQVFPDQVKGTPFGAASQVGGQPALVNIPAGSQVSQEDVGTKGGAPIPAQLKPGEKAIAFQVDPVTGLNFLVQQGDRIDIVLAEKVTVLQPTADTATLPAARQRFETVPGLEGQRTVKTILQNKRVLYVNRQTTVQTVQSQASASPLPAGQQPQTTQQTIGTAIIVFAGTDQDAEAIKFAQQDNSEIGFLTVAIRSTQDTAIEKTTGLTLDRLVTQYGLVLPNIIKLPTR
jgi:Flp pilus assembly protein CpaB